MRRDAIDGVIELLPERFADERGYLSETYNRRVFLERGLDPAFVQENESFSISCGVVRGLHFQVASHQQAKLIRVLSGAIVDVAVDLRAGSATFLDHVVVRLDGGRGNQLWIPPGFAHGFCTLEPATTVGYKLTEFWSPASERRIRFDDPDLAIGWPVDPAAAIVSPADATAPLLRELGDPTALLGSV